MGLGGPFVLGSWVALGPAVVVAAWVVLRTVLEDRTLQRELEGYAAASSPASSDPAEPAGPPHSCRAERSSRATKKLTKARPSEERAQL